jgi:biotin carboxylase
MSRERGASVNGSAHVLYVGTRSLPLERDAELEAAFAAGLSPVVAAASARPYAGHPLHHIVETALGDYARAEREILEYLRAKDLTVEGVVAWADREVELTARLAARLGLPGSTEAAALRVRNKAAMRQALAGVAGANPPFAVVTTEAECAAALEQVGVPALLKPAGASGGRGQFIVTSPGHARTTFAEFRRHCDPARDEIYAFHGGEAVLEELLDGSEHSVAGLVAGGRVHILAVTDKKADPQLRWQYQTTVPSTLSDATRRTVVALARAAVAALGIDHCGFHVDIMVTPAGPRVLEVGGRFGGECINSHLVPLVLPSVRPYEALLEVVRGRDPGLAPDSSAAAVRRAGLRHLLPPAPGTITRVSGLETLATHPSVRACWQARHVGDRVAHPRDVYNAISVGYVVAECPLDEDIDTLLSDLAARVVIEVED